MKKLFFVLGCGLFFAACNNSASDKETRDTTYTTDHTQMNDTGTTTGNVGTTTGNTMLNDMDRDFVKKAGVANSAEIELGKMAQQKSTNESVKEFGRMMEQDHGNAQSDLKNTISGTEAMVSDSLDKEHMTLKNKLNGLSGAKFDREYISAMVDGHKKVVALFEKQISGGSHSGLKQFATNTLPHIKAHLQRAEEIKSGLK